MNRNIFISKKMYVAPLVSFEEVEEEQELLAGSTTTGFAPGEGNPQLPPGTDPNDFPGGSNGAKKYGGSFVDGGEGDFVFEIDGME